MTGLMILLALSAGLGLVRAAPHEPQAAPPTRVYLPLVTGSGAPSAGRPSSAALIAGAEQRGEIDAETALLYQVFATFNSPQLPARFRGDDSAVDDEVISLVLARYPGLSATARATLAPFLTPPFHAGSWWELQQGSARGLAPTLSGIRCGQDNPKADLPLTGWDYIDSSNGATRIWWQTRYPEDELKAKQFAAQVNQIWYQLATLMKREPPSDQGDDKSCRGGDDRLDIAIAEISGAGGLAIPYTYDPVATPSYLLLDRQAGRGTLIHELMHSFQFAFDIAGSYMESMWWREGSASWSEHYVDPTANREHRVAPHFLKDPALALEHYSSIFDPADSPGYAHQYGTYLLALYEQLNGGGPDFVRRSWEAFERQSDSLAAIDGLLNGGFLKTWPRFAVNNLNVPPVNQYGVSDKLSARYKPQSSYEVALGGAPELSYPLDGRVPHLAAHVYDFTFSDLSARSVTFENPYAFRNFPTASVWAVYESAAGYHVEDWTNQQWTTFCRDVKAERLLRLRIVIANSEWKDRSGVLSPASPPRLRATNMACRGWEVSVKATVRYHGPSADHTTTMTTTATFERVRPAVMRAYPYEYYRAAGGTVQWSNAGYAAICSGSGSGTYSLSDPTANHTMIVENYGVGFGIGVVTVPPEQSGRRGYSILGYRPSNQPSPSVTYTCPESPMFPTKEVRVPVDLWLQTEQERGLIHSLASSGRAGSGSYSFTARDGMNVFQTDHTFTWEIRALPPE